MKIIVTGSSGYIGTELCRELENHGHQVLRIDKRRNFDLLKLRGPSDIAWITCSQFEADAMIHLAATPRVPASISDPAGTLANNVLSTSAVLEYAKYESLRNKKFKLLMAGSSAGKSDKIPVSPYGVHKQCAESLGAVYRDLWKMDVATARLFNVYDDQSPDGTHRTLISALIHATKEQTTFNHYRHRRSPKRDFCHLGDTVEALRRLIEVESRWMTHMYEIGIGESHETDRVVSYWIAGCKQRGIPFNWDELPGRMGDVEKTWADTDDLYKEIRWEPRRELYQEIDAIFNAWKTTKNDT